jgi:hypothetical protein
VRITDAGGGHSAARSSRGVPHSIAMVLPKQVRQPRGVDGDPPRLVGRQHLDLQWVGFVLPRVDADERPPVGVADDIAAPGISSARQGAGQSAHALGQIASKGHTSISLVAGVTPP